MSNKPSVWQAVLRRWGPVFLTPEHSLAGTVWQQGNPRNVSLWNYIASFPSNLSPLTFFCSALSAVDPLLLGPCHLCQHSSGMVGSGRVKPGLTNARCTSFWFPSTEPLWAAWEQAYEQPSQDSCPRHELLIHNSPVNAENRKDNNKKSTLKLPRRKLKWYCCFSIASSLGKCYFHSKTGPFETVMHISPS